MFDKLKQLKDLQNQAKNLKNQLAEETVEVEKDGIKLVMSGNQEIISLNIEPSLQAEKIEKILPLLFDEAIKKVQRLMMEKFQAGGMNLPNF